MLLSTACNDTVINDGVGFKTEQTKTAAGEKKDKAATGENNNVDPQTQLPVAAQPIAIGGAFLYMKCAEEIAPNATRFESLVGCRLEDAQGTRKAASSVYSNFEFGWKALSAENLRVIVKNVPGDQRYDTVFLFQSTSLMSLEDSLQSVQIIFRKADSTEQFSRTFPDILVPLASISDKANIDYQAIRMELSAAVTSGQPTPPIP